MKHKTVIFDLDGTLLDTLETLSYYGNKTLEELGLAPYDKDDYRYMVGNGAKVLIQRMLKGREREDLFDQAYPLYINAYHSDTLYKTEIYPDIPMLLKSLLEKDVKIAVLSNKPHVATVPIIKSFFGEDAFAEIRGAMEGVPIKPDPTVALEIAGNLQCRPEECLYVGDTAVDMEMAHRAGFYAVGVLWGFRDRKELSESGADCIVENPMKILMYL